MRGWIYETDEAGKPRRFLTHGEAALWSAKTVVRRSRRFLVPGAAGGAGGVGGVRYLSEERGAFEVPDPASVAILIASVLAFLLALGLAAAVVLYLYVALSGGVMDEEARRRYRNNESLPRPR